ncbi:MAG: M20 family metallopeptidase [Bacteroides sp.]|nr:M20 family metallopeptidase [Bacteroides sp.]
MIASAEQLKEELVQIRRTLHKYPEVGRSLPQTKAQVLAKLREYGYEPREVGESGIVAEISGGSADKTILLRADMDALAVKEETGLPYASGNDAMHACGHDMHATMLLGAAKLLRQYRDQIDGNVRLVFQPDEEGFTGAKEMLAAGVLDNPRADVGMALHVHSGTPTGVILGGLGTCMAGCTLFRIRVKGKGCHGAMPETGTDPINIAAHIFLALQTVNARENSPLRPMTLTIGKFAGGEAPNIIPEEAVMEGTIRTQDKELAGQILERVGEIAGQTAALFRGTAEVEELASAPPLYNDPDLVREITGYIGEIYDAKRINLFEQGGMGSEDFASYTQEIPCCYLLLGAGAAAENELYGKPMHNNRVVFNEDILPLGSAILAYGALRWLQGERS